MGERWYGDFVVGDVIVTPQKVLSAEGIIDYATTFDPQPFHTDAVLAKQTIYGGLIASGWHIGALAFSLFMATKPFAVGASLGSPGVDELRWRAPVRPGDTIHARIETTEQRISRSAPRRGLVTLDWAVMNQREQTVMTMKSVQLVARHPSDR